ncbi:hypothetical protein [Azospirillum sp. Sh1]|uniref:hypothetical protein n=1 Tax=Azospirillum sp. Sh1 TaxID=2607285 RepID=UPI0011ED332A|nr:hypothetical protein [Azospirillum sp. Sh1]KAA0582685.1 hypothetical protein FZ029_00910 [Azospirillum sp. Sh1]
MATFNGTDWTFADFSGADGYAYTENWDPFWDDVIAEMDARREDLGSALAATSATNSVAIGTGSKTLTITTGKGFVAGMWVAATDAANAANTMVGQVTSHVPTTGALTLSVLAGNTTGGGTPSSWTIGISGKPGPTPSSFPAGTVGAPGWAVTGDPNTGLAQIGGADTISLVAGGTEALRATTGGNIAAAGTMTASGISATVRVDIGGTDPTLCMTESDAAADNRKWDWLPINGALNCRLVNDAYSAAYTWLTVSRVGVMSARMAFGGPATAKQATVAYASTITLDFASQDYVIGDLTGPLTLANPSAYPVGQRGEILVHEDGTGGRTVGFGTNWIKIGKDTVNSAAGKYSVITYWVVSGSVVIYSIAGGA